MKSNKDVFVMILVVASITLGYTLGIEYDNSQIEKEIEKEQMRNLVKQIIDFHIAIENISHHEWTQMRVEGIQDETRCSQLKFELVELYNLVKNEPDTYPEMFYYYWLTEQQHTKYCGELSPVPECDWDSQWSRCNRA